PVMRSNYRSLPDTCRWAEKEGIPLRLDLDVFPRPGTDWRSDAELLHGEELSAAVERLGNDLPLPEAADSGPEYSLCAAGTRFCVIRPDGQVRACSFLPETAGDLTRDPFTTIWTQSPVFRSLRAVDRRTWHDCVRCALEPFCRRCPAFICLLGGSLDKIPPVICDMCRRRFTARSPGSGDSAESGNG
ncbi:MAG: SPASM domain-containing protein, partial [Acidobacteria bacterium]|nr:SPASM domain-containing protein [Acidobacteriota bacterium]